MSFFFFKFPTLRIIIFSFLAKIFHSIQGTNIYFAYYLLPKVRTYGQQLAKGYTICISNSSVTVTILLRLVSQSVEIHHWRSTCLLTLEQKYCVDGALYYRGILLFFQVSISLEHLQKACLPAVSFWKRSVMNSSRGKLVSWHHTSKILL